MGEVTRHSDPRQFLEAVRPFLERGEAANNLVLGIAGTLVHRPEIYERHHLWSVSGDGETVAVALMTPPFKLAVADTTSPTALADLVDAVADDLGRIPGVVANHPTVGGFVEAWTARTGAVAALETAQGVFSLDTVADVPVPDGRPRAATGDDLDLLAGWVTAFNAEALPGQGGGLDWSRRYVEVRLEGDPSLGILLWEAGGEAVSMSAHGSPTTNGIRISAVYTPPRQRRRGYATALVADQSRRLLGAGYRFCFLNTDMANPTSNSVYRRIGYRQVAESAQYRFD